MAVRRRRAAAEPGQCDCADLERHRQLGEAPSVLGRARASGTAHRVLRRARRARRLLRHSQPDDARLRGARRRLQPGGGGVRRHQRAQEPHPGHGDLGRVCRARGSARHDGLPLPLRPIRHSGQPGRLPRDRRRAVGPQHGGRRRHRRTSLRRAPVRDDTRPPGRLELDRSIARRQPHVHHPGADRAVRRCGRTDPLRLELAQEAATAGGNDVNAWVQRLDNPLSAWLRDPAATGYAALFLGAFAAFLAIPPIQARTVTWPIVVGVVAATLGIWTATRGRRRLGYGAVAAGLIGIGLGILATRSGTGNLNAVFNAQLIAQMFASSTPLIFGAIAGMFSERSGVVNVGLEGMMLMGAFWGVYGADVGGSWVVGLIIGMASGGLLALVYAYFAIH